MKFKLAELRSAGFFFSIAIQSRMPVDLNALPPQLREQFSLNQALVTALVRGVPKHWNSATLQAKWAHETSQMSLTVTSPDDPQPANITEEIQAAAEQLTSFRQKYRMSWIEATFSIVKSDTQGWQVSVEFA